MAISGKTIAQPVNSFLSGNPFEIGPFRITPLLTDHSAFDAHMILVEVAGRRVLYTGDFRKTGRKAALLPRLQRSIPRDIDVLLMEGTTLGRSEGFPTETELEKEFLHVFKKSLGRVFVTWSAQNIDRTVTIYRACKKANRTLFLDLYSLHVLETLSEFCTSLPVLGWPKVAGVVSHGINRLFSIQGRTSDPGFIQRCCSSGKAFGASRLENGAQDIVVMLRPGLFRDYQNKGLKITQTDSWVFSMWSGYRAAPEYISIKQAFLEAGGEVSTIHTSGHASSSDLIAFANSTGARFLIPIHGEEWGKHLGDFKGVKALRNGQSFELVGLRSVTE
jgi:ribonuclease J